VHCDVVVVLHRHRHPVVRHPVANLAQARDHPLPRRRGARPGPSSDVKTRTAVELSRAPRRHSASTQANFISRNGTSAATEAPKSV
jgi:hypothetical protein